MSQAVPLPKNRCPRCHHRTYPDPLPSVASVRAAFKMIHSELRRGWWSGAGIRKKYLPETEAVFFGAGPIDTNAAYFSADGLTEGILSTGSSCKPEHRDAVDTIRALFGQHAGEARDVLSVKREPWAVAQVRARIQRFRRLAKKVRP